LESRILIYDPSADSDSKRRRHRGEKTSVQDRNKHVKLVTSANGPLAETQRKMEMLVNARFLHIEDDQLYTINPIELKGKCPSD
jgi:hypothetical protein